MTITSVGIRATSQTRSIVRAAISASSGVRLQTGTTSTLRILSGGPLAVARVLRAGAVRDAPRGAVAVRGAAQPARAAGRPHLAEHVDDALRVVGEEHLAVAAVELVRGRDAAPFRRERPARARGCGPSAAAARPRRLPALGGAIDLACTRASPGRRAATRWRPGRGPLPRSGGRTRRSRSAAASRCGLPGGTRPPVPAAQAPRQLDVDRVLETLVVQPVTQVQRALRRHPPLPEAPPVDALARLEVR